MCSIRSSRKLVRTLLAIVVVVDVLIRSVGVRPGRGEKSAVEAEDASLQNQTHDRAAELAQLTVDNKGRFSSAGSDARKRSSDASTHETTNSLLGYAAGSIFLDQFRLEARSQQHDGLGASSLLEEGNEAEEKGPRVEWPRSGINDFKEGKFVGGGSFGEAWQAVGLPGSGFENKRVVLKMLYVASEHLIDFDLGEEASKAPYLHLTKGILEAEAKVIKGKACKICMKSAKKKLLKQIKATVEECELIQKVHRESNTMDAGIRRYSQRLMQCYKHNYNDEGADENTPLYLVLEDCGEKDLMGYTKGRTVDIKELASITRQIVEARKHCHQAGG
eukprot:gnl/TRDRNA2_/TRDRNA2_83843_c0_seq2.p1 gnl/TRDRNA2_/TRDRNA2_83843_c0~~gnl/TRDRNA2_/TRDRNA2_83843_c0_seq2.p1  ORF type:complete len:333 (+),score=54.66 gnl/TRDRNA2_/TRDRNA2_83843_c0_seq2:62-1060(+)